MRSSVLIYHRSPPLRAIKCRILAVKGGVTISAKPWWEKDLRPKVCWDEENFDARGNFRLPCLKSISRPIGLLRKCALG